MTETCRVLSMLNATASRQLKNGQFEAARRTVHEAIRYFAESEKRKRMARNSSSAPNNNKFDLMVLCQAQVSIMLKVKIGRMEVALDSQTKNGRVVLQAGNKTMAQCTRILRQLLKERNSKSRVHGKLMK